MALLKLFFLSCDGGISLKITSPSGHVAACTLVEGSAYVIAYFQITASLRTLLLALTVAIVVAIVASRAALGAHSPIEVVIRTTVGALFLAGFATAFNRLPLKTIKFGLLAGGITVALVTLHGHHLPAEELLRHSTVNKQQQSYPLLAPPSR